MRADRWACSARRSTTGTSGHVVSRPALGLLVPPDDGLGARIGLPVPVAGGAVVEDAHVVGPGPPEARVEAEPSRIGLRVAALREVLAVGEDARVDPGAGRRRAVGLQIADLADQIALLEPGLRVVAQRVAVDLAQHVLGRGVGPEGFLDDLVPAAPSSRWTRSRTRRNTSSTISPSGLACPGGFTAACRHCTMPPELLMVPFFSMKKAAGSRITSVSIVFGSTPGPLPEASPSPSPRSPGARASRGSPSRRTSD